MVVHIPQAFIIFSGAITGILAISAISYYRHRDDSSNSRRSTMNDQTSQNQLVTGESSLLDTSGGSNRSSRLRRSRSIRRRRNRSSPNSIENDPNLSDIDESMDMKKAPTYFKDWNNDENRNLLNLLSFISLNQSQKEGYIHRKQSCYLCFSG